ncbi:MAG: TRAP transporter substrate-binding protein DctP [Clostridiales Family XIII bacterium]|jgi:TRAP-type C4-dicarboxylate transport system substrate-binding protein|nr:TRAP transporter substrate-binding protein DctP [Clostridiales Family XIII bacterium]
MKKARLLMVLLLVLAVAFSASACGGNGDGGDKDAQTDEKIVLRLAADVPLEHMLTQINKDACEMVKERTDGRVEIQYFPASQLGSYENVFEEVSMGTIDISQNAIPDTLDPKLGAQYLPYYATSFDEAKILYGKGSYMYQLYEEVCHGVGVKFLGFSPEGFIGFGFIKSPKDPLTPGASKDVKMRSPSTLTFRYGLEDLGFSPVTIPYAEVPTAMQTHVVDGWVGGTPNINYAWMGDLLTEFYVNYIHLEATSYVISEKSLSKLSDEDQQALLDVFQEQSEKCFAEAEANEETYKQKLEEAGVSVIELTDDQKSQFADFIRDKTWTRLEEVLGTDVISTFREEIRQFE